MAAGPGRALPRWAALGALLAVVAVLYGVTLYPGVGGRLNAGDSAKFQYVGSILGVPHQPGYPQYVLLTYLWTRLPLPLELARAVNLLSAVFALAGGAFLFLALERLSGSRAAAALGVLSLLLGRTVWSFSTEAEVYSLNLAWLGVVVWLALAWHGSRDWRWLAALLAAYAASFGNHPLMITLLPALAALLLVAGRGQVLRPRTLVFAAAVVAASAAQYGFLVWRSHSDSPLIEGIRREAEVADLADTISGRRFTDQHLLAEGWAGAGRRLAEVPAKAGSQITWPAVLLALAGAGWLLRRDPARGLFVALGIAVPILFAAVYQIGDWDPYLTPAWALACAGAAVAAGRLPDRWRAGRWALLAAWAAAVVWMAAGNFGALTVEHNPWDRSRLFRVAEPGSIVVTYPGPGYRSLELNRYHRFGLGLEERLDVEIQTAAQVFEQHFSFLGDRTLVFGGDRRVRKQFDDYRVDTARRWLVGEPDSEYFYTATVYPLSRLEARPRKRGGLELTRDHGERVVTAASSLQLVVVCPERRRIKGAVAVPLTGLPAGEAGRRALQVLRHVQPGDWVAALADRHRLDRQKSLLEGVARALGHPVESVAGASRSLVLWGPKWGPRAAQRAFLDPQGPVVMELER